MLRGNRPVDLSGACVLVVDDEDVVRKVTASVLKRLGYQVLEANSGTEGVRLAEEQAGRIDLLLTDITMGDVSGIEVAIAFRKSNPQRPVVFTSGYGAEDVLRNADQEGAHFLEKPYDVNRLARMVEDALAKGAQERGLKKEVKE